MKTTVTLNFDGKELEVFNKLEELKMKHKLSNVITNFMRIYVDEPERFPEVTEDKGITAIRFKRFNEIKAIYEKSIREQEEISNKLKKLTELVIEMKALTMAMGEIDREKSVKNVETGRFILQQEVKRLESILGTQFSKEAPKDVEESVIKAINILIKKYGNVLLELTGNKFSKEQERILKEELKTFDLGTDDDEKIFIG